MNRKKYKVVKKKIRRDAKDLLKTVRRNGAVTQEVHSFVENFGHHPFGSVKRLVGKVKSLGAANV